MDKGKTRAQSEKPSKKSLGEMLIEEKIITSQQLESALAIQRQKGGRLNDILFSELLDRHHATFFKNRK